MLTVLSFCQKDRHLAELLALWISDLGGVKAHECMLVVPAGVSPGGIVEPLQSAFGKVFILPVNDRDPGHWPEGPNLMFRRAARQIEATSPQPWFWLEPDAVPLDPDWLDKLSAEYTAGAKQKPFMGARVVLPSIPTHMSGVAVYPGNAPTLAPLLVTCMKVAFDVNGAREVVPRMANTALIQHDWKPASFASTADLLRIREGAVIYHQCKDGSLIARLRELRGTTPELIHEEGPAVEVEPAREADPAAATRMLADALFPVTTPPPVDTDSGTVNLKFKDPDDACQQLCAGLKSIYDLGRNEARMVSMYLAAAGLIPSSPMAPPKPKPARGRPGRPKKAAKPDAPAATLVAPEGYAVLAGPDYERGTTNASDLIWNKDKEKWQEVHSVNAYCSDYIAVARRVAIEAPSARQPEQ